METLYNDLEDLCEIVSDKISEANKKMMQGGDLTGGDVEYLDKLTHMLKSIKTTMAMMDAESGEYSGNDRYSYDNGRNNGGMSGRRYYSGARGRSQRTGRYVSRMGRRSGDDQMVSELRELMEDAPDEKTRAEFQKFISKIEQM